MSHEIMTKEARDQLDTMVLTDVRERVGSRSLVCIETMRFAAAAAGAGRTKGAIDRSLQRLRKAGLVVHSTGIGWRPVPRCKTCDVLLPHGKLVQSTQGTWCHEHAEDMRGPTW